MIKYKTIVTDYEGLQRCLDDSSESGWRLFCVQPDTWRKVTGSSGDSDPLEAMGGPAGESTTQFSASYYLVILFREDGVDQQAVGVSQSEDLPFGEFPSGSY